MFKRILVFFFLLQLLLFSTRLFSDFELLEEESTLDFEEHFYILQERINIQYASRSELAEIPYLTLQDITKILNYRRRNIIINTEYLLDAGLSRDTISNILPYIDFGRSRRLEYNSLNYLRYNDSSGNVRIINRLTASNNVYDLRLHQEHNSVSKNTTIPFGASLSIKNSPTKRMVLGQFQLNHAYGLLLSRGSFVSQKPGFNTEFKRNRTTLSANARSYYSRSFFGVAYENSLLDNLSIIIYGSSKDTGVRLNNGQIERLLLDDKDPNESVFVYNFGGVLLYQLGEFIVSGAVNYSYANFISPLETSHLSNTGFNDNINPLVGSIAASYEFDRYLLFSETAYSFRSFANIIGFQSSFQRFTQLLCVRHFENGFESFFGDYVSNSASGSNEKGLLYKVDFRNRHYMLQTYADIFSNIENDERYMDRNRGVSIGLRGEKYSLFGFDQMNIGASYRQKLDKEWRNLSGITKYEDRKRDFFRAFWQQTDTKFLKTRLLYDYQTREYLDHENIARGYVLSQSINMQFTGYRYSFTAGVFDTQTPIYLYLYSGRLNNPLFILNGDGLYTLFHVSINKWEKLTLEIVNSVLKKEKTEYLASILVNCKI